jgi:hypothetical protein
MPKQYFDTKKQYFDHNRKYFADNLDQTAPPKPKPSKNPPLDLKKYKKIDQRHAHITVDDRGDSMSGGVSVQAIEDFRARAKTRVRHHQIQTVTPSGIKMQAFADAREAWKDTEVCFKDAELALNNAPFARKVKKQLKRSRKPPPKPPKTSFSEDVLDLVGMGWFKDI